MLQSLLNRAPSVSWTRSALETRRQTIAAAHARGASGVETVTALTMLADDILRDLYVREYAGTFNPTGVALVALGGYGRREFAPYSDIDLMFLYEPLHEREARAVSTAILHVLWDLGFLVGHSLRTIADCRSMGRTDLTVRTSLMEARWLAGDQTPVGEFPRSYREQVAGKRVPDYVAEKLLGVDARELVEEGLVSGQPARRVHAHLPRAGFREKGAGLRGPKARRSATGIWEVRVHQLPAGAEHKKESGRVERSASAQMDSPRPLRDVVIGGPLRQRSAVSR